MSRLLFTKEGVSIWSSHLDLMRALMRSFRRAGIELKHSQGFTPHPELSILMPLSVGVESRCEIAEFALAEGCEIPAEEIAARLNPVLPAGIRALESWEGGQKAGKLAWLRARLTLSYEASGIRHQASGDGGADSSAPLRSPFDFAQGKAENDRIEAIRALFGRPSLVVEKHGKKGVVETDIASMIRELVVKGTGNGEPGTGDAADSAAGENAVVLEAVVAAQNPTLNPLLLATAIERYLPEYKPALVQCRRLEIYDADLRPFR
ncbi:MAG: DUF2344 domain-containing protein [Oscillospiraceae bacterium]|nr:DUF2344 domain-containing protein [Oscillospiraceae bacterium]